MKLTILFAIMFAAVAPLRLTSAQHEDAASVRSSPNKDRNQYVGVLNERNLSWRPFEVGGVPPGIQVKLLSRDAKSGAASLLARFPAGWRNSATGYHSSDMELFVLKGAIKMGDRQFTERCFTYIPASVSYGPVVVEKETTALWFFEGDSTFTASATSREGAEINKRIDFKSYYKEPWAAAVEAGFTKQPGFVKMLKRLPNDGPMTWIGGIFSGDTPGKYEDHPNAEEAWLLEGEFNLAECLPDGLQTWHLTEGSYFFRPPSIRHIGPLSGTHSYAIWLFRTPMKLESHYSDICR